MIMVTLGIPTLNRYDLLEYTIRSAEAGTLKPNKYLIIDNGNRFVMNPFYESLEGRLTVIQPGSNLGCAGGWNKIIKNTLDKRIIANDDVAFFEDTIELLSKSFSENAVTFPAGMPAANAFSCFLIPDAVVNKVGYFDEKLSPNYAYFEDNDYHRRMLIHGVELLGVSDCRLGHLPSSTLSNFSDVELRQHHSKFTIAQKNYIRKWGGVPGQETLSTPREL